MTSVYRSPQGAEELRRRYGEILSRWPVPHERVEVPTRAGATSVVVSGPADGPPVVLLHGSGTNSAMWMGDVATWAERFRVHAVDLIGEPGLSAESRPRLASGAYGPWLDDTLRGLGLTGRVSIVGASLGGWMAVDHASRHPERVERLALLCPGGIGRQKASFAIKAMARALLGERGMRRTLRTAMGASPGAAGPAEEAFLDYATAIFRHFRPRRERLPVFGDEALRRLTMPVLAIVGGRDALLDSYETARRLERCAPRAVVRLLPDAGHGLRGQTGVVGDFLSDGGGTREGTPGT